MTTHPNPASHAIRGYGTVLWVLTFLFFMRILGQALQYWMPQPFLPPFDAFQGSSLPYWFLLFTQLLILVVMMCLSWRVQHNKLVSSRRAGMVLAWAGGLYMAGSLGRIAIGLAWPEAPAWFSAWISAVFHVVLAWFVLTLALYHRRESHLRAGEAHR